MIHKYIKRTFKQIISHFLFALPYRLSFSTSAASSSEDYPGHLAGRTHLSLVLNTVLHCIE